METASDPREAKTWRFVAKTAGHYKWVDEGRLLAKCEEMLAFLAAQPGHAKLRSLADDIEALRDRLRAELGQRGLRLTEPDEGPAGSPDEAAS